VELIPWFGQAKSLAPHAIVVAVQMRTVPGIAAPHGRSTGGACFGAIPERATTRRRRSIQVLPQVPGAGFRLRGRAAMAVVIARLAVGVAAIRIEAAAVRERGSSRRKRQDKQDDEGKMHYFPCNPMTWHSPAGVAGVSEVNPGAAVGLTRATC